MRFSRLFPMVAVVSMATLSIVACSRETGRHSETDRSTPTPPGSAQTGRGEALFRQFCANCHPDGSNVSDPARTLHRSTLQANGITKPEDIIRIMRHPISRMLRFDVKTLPDEDARAIAEYVLDAF